MKRRVIALGFFDGVHLGHAALLRRTAEAAKALGAAAAACTFDIHPQSLITRCQVPLLTTPEDREALMRELCGIGEVLVLPFDRRRMTTPWEEFVTDCLVGELGACHLVCGHDYRFGYRGEGDPQRLRTLCARLGVGCEVVERVELDGVTVSSSHIRALIAQGEMEEADRFLGHPYRLSGRVVHGKGLGGRLGFPTVNLIPDPRLLLPAYGVYAARARLPDGRAYPACTNVGVRPTVEDGGGLTVESFLLDYQGDLYGRELRLELYRRLRPERAFDSLEALRREIRRNVAETRAYFDKTRQRGEGGRPE